MSEFKTIGVRFGEAPRLYTYKTKKLDIKVGDRVMVETKNGQQVVDVIEVHAVPASEEKFKIKEIVSWIDPSTEV